MRKQTHYAATLILFVAFFNANLPDHVSLYIGTYKDIAIQEMNRSGIPASIILAQGIHESAWGKGKLAVKSNNHFGIKCKEYWTGPKYYHKDDDYDGNGNLLKSCFRAYENSEASYLDHTEFLVSSPRYKRLFSFGNTDYVSWAKGLKKCGYATDPAYAEKLIRTIKKYGLDEYDRQMNKPEVAAAPIYTIPEENTDIQNLFVQEEEVQQEEQLPEYQTPIYDVPAAMPIPDDYQRVNFQSSFKEEPVVQDAVPTITAEYNKYNEQNKLEEYNEYNEAEVTEQQVPMPEVIEIVAPESVEEEPILFAEEHLVEDYIAPSPVEVTRHEKLMNSATIIPIKNSKRQRNTQLGRKPRTNHSRLR